MGMRTPFLAIAAASIGLLLAGIASTQARAQLVNPSFEAPATEKDAGWTLFDLSRYSDKYARGGKRSLFHFGFSRTVSYAPFLLGNVAGSFQEFDAEPGSQWRLTGYAMTPTPLKGTPAFGIVQISFFDADGNDLGTLETVGSEVAKAKTSNELNNRSAPEVWTLLDTGVATAPKNTATVQAFTLYVDYSNSNVSQGVYFDDLTLCRVSDTGECIDQP
ncbi:MAG: hypothetical protein AAF270_04310 [Pseudomonadota bacterium]